VNSHPQELPELALQSILWCLREWGGHTSGVNLDLREWPEYFGTLESGLNYTGVPSFQG
jgi:hypothetical protein